MTKQNAQSIAPLDPPVTSPQIDDSETQGTLHVGPSHIAARSNRTPEEVERNRAFMAAAGRVEFGRYEATQRAVWIAFAYFASLGVERICYATVEHVAERAKVSARTVQRHIPALIERGRIYAETRVGGRTPAVWKVILPDELMGPGVTACHPRGDSMSDDIRDRTFFPGRAAKPQARPGGKGVKSGSSPVTTAAPLKGSPAPSPSPLIVLPTAEQIEPHIEAMREIVQRATETTSTTEDQPAHQPSSFKLDPDTEARMFEADRLLHESTEALGFPAVGSLGPPPKPTGGCPQCGNQRLMGGSCDQCGHDDGTGFRPSADYNAGGDV